MDKEELIQYLKDNLSAQISISNSYGVVTVKLELLLDYKVINESQDSYYEQEK